MQDKNTKDEAKEADAHTDKIRRSFDRSTGDPNIGARASFAVLASAYRPDRRPRRHC